MHWQDLVEKVRFERVTGEMVFHTLLPEQLHWTVWVVTLNLQDWQFTKLSVVAQTGAGESSAKVVQHWQSIPVVWLPEAEQAH